VKAVYHRQLCEETLGDFFAPDALEAVIAANVGQDALLGGFFGHPEYHFDESKFERGWAYVGSQREAVRTSLANGAPAGQARAAFGRLLHAVQDFYAHSNYARLWAAHYGEGDLPPVEAFDGLNEHLLNHSDLRSGNVYYPLEFLTFFERTRAWATRRLPADSHAQMNLDYPERGPLFWYAMEGARQASARELGRALEGMSGAARARFGGKGR
jgi:hypothetical protein